MLKMGQLRDQLALAEGLADRGDTARAFAQLAGLVREVIASIVEEDAPAKVHDSEAIDYSRRERERVWSLWLDAAPALQLELADDREELAERLAEAVRELPRRDVGDHWKKHG